MRMNTRAAKGGDGCDAPRWWKEGRHAQLQRYCAQDVRVLVDLVVRKDIRVPGGGVTRDASVRHVVTEAAGVPVVAHDGICAECGGPTGDAASGGVVGARVGDALIGRLHEHGVTDARAIPLRTIEEYRVLLGGLTAAEEAQLRSVEVPTEAERRARTAYLLSLIHI